MVGTYNRERNGTLTPIANDHVCYYHVCVTS